MKAKIRHRVFAAVLVLCMVMQLAPTAFAASGSSSDTTALRFTPSSLDVSASLNENAIAKDDEDEAPYAADDMVRVSIVLSKAATLAAGFAVEAVAVDDDALTYRAELQNDHAEAEETIEDVIEDELDVVWDLTLAANLISANIRYDQIAAIENLEGVEKVVIENRYLPAQATKNTSDPNMATSSEQIGSTTAYNTGYYGAGSRIAVIDTGTDTDHQSFSAAGLEYALQQRAKEQNIDADTYIASLDLLDAAEIESVLDQLNIQYVRANQLYLNSKLPFAYNYVDMDYDVTHDNDDQGEHGSHVAGIAAANAFVPDGSGGYEDALESVFVQGVAPDAQILTMKVFGTNGGAYDSDYMAAIEDAIVLGADVINLSLGSSFPGFSNSAEEYQEIMDNLEQSGVVVVIAAGNAYSWASFSDSGYLYSEDVSLDMVGAPASFTNSLSVASVDNSGFTGYYIQVGEKKLNYTDNTEEYTNEPLITLKGDHEYILIDGIGSDEEFAALADVLAGKIAVCARGTLSFSDKTNNAVKYGAIATLIYNNTSGTFNMDLSKYTGTAPAVTLTASQGAWMKEQAEAVTLENGSVYYKGTLTISDELITMQLGASYDTMSEFSSWGVPGSLELKPEITAPGGNIYSVNGQTPGGTSYENMSGTSMAAPQVAGMAALLTEHLKTTHVTDDQQKIRTLAQSLLMSTAVPIQEESTKNPYSILKQGAGLANIGNAVSSRSYIMMDEGANSGASDGKVKVELGDDPARTGTYTFGFTLTNFSDQSLSYTLSSDFYTQDLIASGENTYLDTGLTTLPVSVSWSVDGVSFVPNASVVCDLDGDEDTDADDAQIILEYCAGNRSSINTAVADLSGDGQVTTYDAHLLLAGMETVSFTVAGDSSVHITASVKISDQTRAFLNQSYPNGAYVEGYAYVEPVTTAENEIPDVTHSIPVLGFYGNWSDASMYDHAEYVNSDVLYGNDGLEPYTGTYQNALSVRYPGSSTVYYQIGNPYWIEDTYPEDRLAVSGGTVLYRYSFGLIRNAAAVAALITDGDGEILYMGPVYNQINSAYYVASSSKWTYTTLSYTLNQRVSALGAKEGEQINVSLVAVPEYYETDGRLTQAELRSLIESDTLGEGAYLTTTMTVDNTAPVAKRIAKDLNTGALLLTVSDNQYIANIQVQDRSGSVKYASVLPEQRAAGETVEVEIDLQDTGASGELVIILCDYANNQSVYTVDYGGDDKDLSGTMVAFTSSKARGSGKRWITIDPENLYYSSSTSYGGTKDYAFTSLNITAAEYVDGYVYMAADDGYLYAAPFDDLGNVQRMGSYTGSTSQIYDMAYSYSEKKLYLLGAYEKTLRNNVIWSVDLISGQLTREYTVSIKNPKSNSANYRQLVNMTIDDEGNFYAVSFGSDVYNYLYTWKNEAVTDGKITNLTAVDHTAETGAIVYVAQIYGGSMAWDHDNDVLYWLNNSTDNSTGADSQYLLKVNTETGKASPVKENAVMYNTTTGFFIVPSGKSGTAKADSDVTSIELSASSLSFQKGTYETLTASIYPWTAKDKSVTWTSDDENVVTVSNGLLHGVGVGTTTITATSTANPSCKAECSVTVTDYQSVQNLCSFIRKDETAYWTQFSTANPGTHETAAVSSVSYLGGVLLDDMLYAHDGKALYQVDPDTFEATLLREMNASWLFANGAAAAETTNGKFGCIIAPCMGGTYIELLWPQDGSMTYFDMSGQFGADPLAVMTLSGYAEEDYELNDFTNMIFATYENCPKYTFYALTESGALWSISILGYGDDNEGGYAIGCEQLAVVDLDLAGVSEADGSRSASALYDASGKQLFIAVDDTLYTIDLATFRVAELGSFGSGTSVTALYQYQRVTELTVRISEETMTLFEGESASLSARVLPAQYTGQISWSSSAPAVAAVDQTGAVTALNGGTAVITASFAGTDGSNSSAACTVTVNALAHVSTEVKAQVVVEDGRALWVTLNTNDVSTLSLDEVAEGWLSAGGVYNGKIYGVASNYSVTGYCYEVDPTNSYHETRGMTMSSANAMLDATGAPAVEISVQDPDTGETLTGTAFGGAAYITYNKNLDGSSSTPQFKILTDFAAGTTSVNSSLGNDSAFAAIAYIGLTVDSSGNPVEQFLAINVDGELYRFDVTATSSVWKSNLYINYTLSKTKLGTVGRSFAGLTALTMAYVNSGANRGLVIGETQKNCVMMWYIDLNAETLDCRKIGKLSGVTSISCLHTAAELTVDSNSTSTSAAITEQKIANKVTGSISAALSGTPSSTALTNDVLSAERISDSALKVTIRVPEQTTNGLYQISYDSSKLTYVGAASAIPNYAVNADTAGQIIFDYALEASVPAGTTAVVLTFSANTRNLNTTVTATEVERCAQTGMNAPHTLTLAYSDAVIPAPTPTPGGTTEPDNAGTAGFVDVKPGIWYYDAVMEMAKLGLVKGVSDTEFAPLDTLNRAMLVTILYRLDGAPSVKTQNSFRDAAAGLWYTDAVNWAAETGIVLGYDDGRFAPDDPITRQQLATILWRYAKYKGYDVSTDGTTIPAFTDRAKIGSWAAQGVSWAYSRGILTGKGNLVLDPESTATRAEAAVMLSRFLRLEKSGERC